MVLQDAATCVSTLLGCRVQDLANSFEALTEHFRIYTHADTKVIGQLEKAPWDGGRFLFSAQPTQKLIDVAVDQAQDGGGAKFRSWSRDGFVVGEKLG